MWCMSSLTVKTERLYVKMYFKYSKKRREADRDILEVNTAPPYLLRVLARYLVPFLFASEGYFF